MPKTLSFRVTLLFNETVGDTYGSWQYAAADLVELGTQRKAQLIATKRTNSYGSNSFPACMLTATIMFAAPNGGVPPNLTLQGVHDLTTNSETGSVSSASPEFADHIGGAFIFDFSKLLLTISLPHH